MKKSWCEPGLFLLFSAEQLAFRSVKAEGYELKTEATN